MMTAFTKAQANRAMSEFQAGLAVRVAGEHVPVWRILGHNPGPMTGLGTNSYLIGEHCRCLLDPGPDDDRQLASLLAAISDGGLKYILATHTHGDHSPAALRLQQATGATLVGMPAAASRGQDHSFQPEQRWQHGDLLDCDDYSIELVHTPGHVSNHICYLLREEQLLFTGDHILQGSTSVILPPDGEMSAYMKSLRYLQGLQLRFLAPGHGAIMDDPAAEIAGLLAHRLRREQKTVAGLGQLGNSDLDGLVETVYDDIPGHLLPLARQTLLAHLIKLEQEGRARREQDRWYLVTAESS